MSCGESDSDTDSVNEFQVKKFLFKSFKERIQQAKAQCEKNTKSGVKRQPGHYHLRDSRHADPDILNKCLSFGNVSCNDDVSQQKSSAANSTSLEELLYFPAKNNKQF
jgi:hypothetical protein